MPKYVVGLFGMVGTGKSTVSNYFQSKKWTYINQDILGHEVIDENIHQIVSLFGKDILENGIINRKLLGKKVFNNEELLTQLMDFSYPIIVQKTQQLLQQYNKSTIVEGAFFYKVREFIPYTHLLYIEVDQDILISRLQVRNHSLDWINQVLKRQQDIPHHKYLADYILKNNTTQQDLYDQIEKFISSLV